MKKLLSLLSIFAIVLSCSSDETATPVTPPPAPIVKYTITLSAGEGGTVSTTGGEYEAGQTVFVTATPQGDYLFKDWSDGNTDATRTITVSSNSTLTANFEKRKYPLTINFEGEGEVIEEIVNAGRTTDYDSGTTVKLTAQAAAEWVFIGWTGDIESTEESVQIVIGEPKEVTAKFEKKKYPLTVNIEGEGEVLEEIVNTGRTTEYDSGTTVKLTAQPEDEWLFTGWVGDIGDKDPTENPIQLSIIESKTVTATFEALTIYTLTVNTNESGLVSISGGRTYSENALDLTSINSNDYTIENPNILIGKYQRRPYENGYHDVEIFLKNGELKWKNAAGITWSLEFRDGELWSGSDGVYDESKLGIYIDDNENVLSVVFNNENYDRVGDTSITKAIVGTSLNVTVSPLEGYEFKDWSDGNTDATRTITILSNTTLTANFEKKKYSLTINIEGEGEVLEEIVNAGRTTDYDSGTTVKLTAQPEDEWLFTGWSGDIGDIDPTDNPIQLSIIESKTITAVFVNKNKLRIESQYANISDHGYVTAGIFAIWWDKKYDMLNEAKIMLDDLEEIRQKALDLWMGDPPNVNRGVYTNIYLHTGSKVGDSWANNGWGAGVGTNTYGVPYMALGKGTARDLLSTIYHEAFHIMQYNGNSFPYSGDTAWYIETTASWFTIVNLMQTRPDIEFFVGATTLPLNPHLALWHSFQNRAIGDPVDWLYEVRQYALEAYLYYLTEVEGFDTKYITNGFYSNITISPQEYLLQQGGAQYRNYFANWAAANTADLNYLTRAQVARAEIEADKYGNSAYRNEYVLEINGENASGTHTPPQNLQPRSWAYNVIKVTNSENKSYKINLNAESKGSNGASSYFKARIVKKSVDNYNINEFTLNDDNITGEINVTLNENEDEFYIVIISVPEQFTGNQTYNYSVTIS